MSDQTYPSTGHAILATLRAVEDHRIVASGSPIREMFLPSERYVIDFGGLLKEGWKQYDTDQDASYFGVWVNLATREVLTYAEGDWSLVTCADDDALRAELAGMAKSYGEAPPAFVSFSSDGTRTDHYDARPEVGEQTS